jgi:hypothetical protein
MSARGAFRPLVTLVGLLLSLPAASSPAEENERDLPHLRAGDSVLLAPAESGHLVPAAGHLDLVLIETSSAAMVLRLTPLDAEGREIGIGRVVVVAPDERRPLRFEDYFSEQQRDCAAMRVEALRGDGMAWVTAERSDGAPLRILPAAEGDPRRRPARLPSSESLIDDAEARGAITAETAMLYRVYALFGDTRLPQQYRGVDRNDKDSLYLFEVVEKFDTLSAGTQALLYPFLTPPAYTTSWANAKGRTDTPLLTPPPCQFFSDDYAFVDSPNRLVRVWYKEDLPDQLTASRIGSTIETTIWPEFQRLLQKTPPQDQAESCNGGSPSLDVYIADVGRAYAAPYNRCSPGPVFIVLGRDRKDSTTVHEVFHAFQAAFSLRSCFSGAEYRWWTEATATWSQDFIYGRTNQDEHSISSYFLSYPEKSLDFRDDQHEYGAYLLPFYLHRVLGDSTFVRESWENGATKDALHAVEDSLVGGFEEVWPGFVRENWNRDPAVSYRREDGLFFAARPQRGRIQEVRLAGGAVDGSIPLPYDLPPLSATYLHFTFSGVDPRTVVFWNGVAERLALQEEYSTEPASEPEKKGATVEALYKINGQWQTAIWTGDSFVQFCRDRRAERIEELVIIISNSEFDDPNRKLKPPALRPVLWVSNMACWQFKGTALHETRGTNGVNIRIETDYIFTSPGGRPDGDPPDVFFTVAGNSHWTVSGSCTGNGIIPVGPGFLQTYNFSVHGARNRGYIVLGINPQPVGVRCGETSASITLPPWIFLKSLEAPFRKVDPSGALILDGDNEESGTWTWVMNAQRE